MKFKYIKQKSTLHHWIISSSAFLALIAIGYSQNTFPSSGNVGIGVSSPGMPLTIYYDYTSGISAGVASWSLSSDGSSGNNTAGRFVVTTTSGSNNISGGQAYVRIATGADYYYAYGGEIGVHDGVAGNGLENVSVSISSDHTGWLSSGVQNDIGLLICGEDGWANPIIYYDTNGATLFYVSNSGTAWAANGWATISSHSAKQQITNLPDSTAMALFSKLKAVRFVYKRDPVAEHHIGFIADDLPFPLSTIDHRAINVPELIGVLTSVVQNQQRAIDKMLQTVHQINKTQMAAAY